MQVGCRDSSITDKYVITALQERLNLLRAADLLVSL